MTEALIADRFLGSGPLNPKEIAISATERSKEKCVVESLERNVIVAGYVNQDIGLLHTRETPNIWFFWGWPANVHDTPALIHWILIAPSKLPARHVSFLAGTDTVHSRHRRRELTMFHKTFAVLKNYLKILAPECRILHRKDTVALNGEVN